MTTLIKDAHRFRLSRAGIFNVWQYDEQIFEFADGRLLLRGTNGAGKSKTLEMLLPFVLDGDIASMDATGRRGSGLKWLMSEGSSSATRLGYVWVEFARTDADGVRHTQTCGIGLRRGSSSDTVSKWFFLTTARIGPGGISLNSPTGPLTMAALREVLGAEGRVFDKPTEFRSAVGSTLFGLDTQRYSELLRLLYWLRRPQVGEDIDPRKLAAMLSDALPSLPEQAVQQVGSTLDELTTFGERIARQETALAELRTLESVHRRYSVGVLRDTAQTLVTADHEARRSTRDLNRRSQLQQQLEQQLHGDKDQREAARHARDRADLTLRELERSPEADQQRNLNLMAQNAASLRNTADRSVERVAAETRRADAAHQQLRSAASSGERQIDGQHQQLQQLSGLLSRLGSPVQMTLQAPVPPPNVRLAIRVSEISTEPELVADEIRGRWQSVAGEIEVQNSTLTALIALLEETGRAIAAAGVARQESDRASEAAAQADASLELAESQLAQAVSAADTAEHEYSDEIIRWAAAPAVVDLDLSTINDAAARDQEWIRNLPTLTREIAGGHERILADNGAEQRSLAKQARTAEKRWRETYREVERQQDPIPPAPHWQRDGRDSSIGLPLWSVVDVRPGTSDQDRAGLEAALEAAGLLDALVLPGGELLAPGTLDSIVLDGPALVGPSLDQILAADPPMGSSIDGSKVSAILRAIGLDSADQVQASAGDALANWVSVDGSFRLGPLTGRSSKPAAQYLGATARAAERARRLQELAILIAEQTEIAETAESTAAELDLALVALRQWISAVPHGDALLQAWRDLTDRTENRNTAQGAAHRAEQLAVAARSRHAKALAVCVELAERAGVAERSGASVDADLVRARTEDARDARKTGQDLLRDIGRRGLELHRWAEQCTQTAVAAQALEEAVAYSEESQETALTAEEALSAARAAADPQLRELSERIRAAESAKALAGKQLHQLQSAIEKTSNELGSATEAVAAAQSLTEATQARLVDSETALRSLGQVTGLIQAALATVTAPGSELPGSEALSETNLRDVATRWAAALDGAPGAGLADLMRAGELARSTAAADHNPRAVAEGEFWTVLAEANSVEGPLGTVTERVHLQVEENRELLSAREKRLFQEHLLGNLGEAVRQRLAESVELVSATNRILGEISTSQGIRVKLDWALQDDAAAGAAEAVGLLRRMGQLDGAERERLREVMFQIIESSKSAAPELSYTDHLAAALDYRKWFAFTVRITRPEWTGQWRALARTTGLSQGEQKVVCYLPLFAAAAAHFTSVAGARAPHAPRFVLLDDAFPKIDVHTHPLLFGLLVDLDLDFVITSERLWGDTARLPSLAIYETLRAPGELGIAQFQYRWDGSSLTSVNN